MLHGVKLVGSLLSVESATVADVLGSLQVEHWKQPFCANRQILCWCCILSVFRKSETCAANKRFEASDDTLRIGSLALRRSAAGLRE